MGQYATEEEVNEYISSRYLDTEEVTDQEIASASLDVDIYAVAGQINAETGLKIDVDELTDHEKICLVRAVAEQIAFKYAMDPVDPDGFMQRYHLPGKVRGADSSEREFAPVKFSPEAEYWLIESGLSQVIANQSTSKNRISGLTIGG